MVGAEHTGATQWDAGHALADYIERTAIGAASCSSDGCYASSRYANRTALELGAGAGGLVSIALIRAGANVLATDGDEGVLEFLNLNIKGNTRGAPWPVPGRRTTVLGRRRRHRRGTKRLALDLVVMSDVVFHTIDTAALVEALAKLAAAEPPPEIIVAHTWRFVREDEDFADAVDAVFDRHTVPAEDAHPRFREGGGAGTRRSCGSCRDGGRRWVVNKLDQGPLYVSPPCASRPRLEQGPRVIHRRVIRNSKASRSLLRSGKERKDNDAES